MKKTESSYSENNQTLLKRNEDNKKKGNKLVHGLESESLKC